VLDGAPRRSVPDAPALGDLQQLARAAARTIDGGLRAPWRGRYPQPEVLLEAPDAQLRAGGLSRQKIKAVRSVAEAFAAATSPTARCARWTTTR
jgi:3-methyladenine DNA glycosylase/8-oxoguanine DNA glycosylase